MNFITKHNTTKFIHSLFIGYVNEYEALNKEKNHITISVYDKLDEEIKIAEMYKSGNISFNNKLIHIDKSLELIKFLTYIKNEITKNPKLINSQK